MKIVSSSSHRFLLTICIMLFYSFPLFSKKGSRRRYTGKSELFKAKKDVLEYLGDSLVIRKYGNISDAIWNYAELGMAGI